jgi:uncharacterized secreted protein with C-terminal beta-propeller domain
VAAGATAAAVGVVAACTGTTVGQAPIPPGSVDPASPNLTLAASLQPFGACDDLLSYVKQAATERVGPYGLQSSSYAVPAGGVLNDAAPPTTIAPTRGPFAGEDQSTTAAGAATSAAPPASAGAPAPQPSAAANGDDHSQTNVQEAGVDEPDTAKTDGTHLFTLTGHTLHESDVSNPAPVHLGSIVLPGNSSDLQMLVAGDHVLVLSNEPASTPSYPYEGGPTSNGTTVLSIVDAANPAAMTISQTVRIDGELLDARMVGSQVRIATSSTAPTNLPFVQPSASSQKARDAAYAANVSIIAGSTIDNWLPTIQIGGPNPTTRPLVDCARVSHPKTFSGFGLAAVVSMDLGGTTIDPANTVGVLGDGQTIYASKDDLYVATPSYVEPERYTPAPGASTSGSSVPGTTAPGTTVPGTSTPPGAPPVPSTVPSPPARPLSTTQTTTVHKFSISAPGAAVYRASGEVDGTVLSSYSMSEDGASLRVVTTSAPQGVYACVDCQFPGAASNLSVLTERDGALVQVGQVGDIGRGEQVKAVRFVGPRAYVVTFRRTDPLYTLDVSDPTDPKVVGSLALLGYSAYLYPLGDHELIGVGQDALANGSTTGLKVALYDVSDLANPRDLSAYVLVNTGTSAEQDFHAFLWWDPTKMAIVPIDRGYTGWINTGCGGHVDVDPGEPMPSSASGSAGGVVSSPTYRPMPTAPVTTAPGETGCGTPTYIPPFTGALALNIDPSGIKEVGQVVNPGPPQRTSSCPQGADCGTYVCPANERCPMPYDGANPAGEDAPVTSTPSTTTPGTTSPTEPSGPPGSTPGTAPSTPTPTGVGPAAVDCSATPCPPAPQPVTPCPQASAGNSTSACESPTAGNSGAKIDRSLVVGNRLYTVSYNGVKVMDLTTLKDLWWLPYS